MNKKLKNNYTFKSEKNRMLSLLIFVRGFWFLVLILAVQNKLHQKLAIQETALAYKSKLVRC